jgi:molybdenum cofactor biosynthesis enzyme MoaA
MINQRLFDHYGIDTTKNRGITQRCPRPFDTLLIDKQGSCFACECQSWLPQSIGNLQIKSMDELLASDMRTHLQSSITDGTYRYCNENQCTYLQFNKWPNEAPTQIQHLRLAIDDSCNLRCPSCRNGLIFHKSGSRLNLGKKLADKINDWLTGVNHDIRVHIGSDGDPFASHVYRHFMEHTPRKDNISYSLLTNALMFQDFHGRIPHVMQRLDNLGVSIDGATESTYEKLRLGGKWDKINSNLAVMAEAKAIHGFTFRLHMVVQQDNWWEMPDMIELAEKYNVDQVYFNKIHDWNTNLDYSQQTYFKQQEFTNLVNQVVGRTEMFGTSPKYLVKGFGLKSID